MSELIEQMAHDILLIQALDIGACLKYASLTSRQPAWYVQADIDITDGEMIHGVSTAETYYPTPWEALQAYRIALQSMSDKEHLVTERRGRRTEWYWNGASFTLAVPFRELKPVETV